MKIERIMATFILVVLFITGISDAISCKLSIPESYVPTFLNPPVSGHYEKCEDKPEEKCHCVEKIDPWSAELIDNEVIDFIRKENTLSCASEEECLKIESEKVCEKGKVIRTESEVYCAVEMMKKDGKKLVESESKKEARRVARQAEKDAEDAEDKARKDSLKALKDAPPVDEPVGTTIAQLRGEVKELTKQVNKLRAILKDVIK